MTVPAPAGALTNGGSNTMSVIDTATNSVTRALPTGDGPLGVAIWSTGGVASIRPRDVRIVDVPPGDVPREDVLPRLVPPPVAQPEVLSPGDVRAKDVRSRRGRHCRFRKCDIKIKNENRNLARQTPDSR
jgi:YVTN family beta-propeller protein